MSSEFAAPGSSALVVDANILVRAVLGRRVLSLLESYTGSMDFLTAEQAFEDARAYLPSILTKRGIPADVTTPLLTEALAGLSGLVTRVPGEAFAYLEPQARERLAGRDEADWPFVALALNFGCPIWTEDQDFFGTGIATWTTDRVEIYLAAQTKG